MTLHTAIGLGRWGWWAAVAALVMAWAVPAEAHWADLAVAEVVVAPRSAEMTLTLPTGLVAEADDDRDGRLSAAEVARHRGWLEARLGAAIALEAAGEPAALSVSHAPFAAAPAATGGTSDRHSTLRLAFAWPAPTEALTLRYGLFVPGVATASCLATVVQDGTARSVVFTPERPSFALSAPSGWRQAAGFVGLGFEHILIGYDHVLFLIALLMLGGGLGYLLKMVTAFTVAHSITLALAAFDVVALPGRLVESAIALSIVYVAAETFWRKDLRGRWVVTLLFGLIHGLGFASVLKELHVAGGDLAVSLVSFNVGVELGQVAIVAAAYGALRLVRRTRWDLAFRRAVSVAVAGMGLVWFVERAFSA